MGFGYAAALGLALVYLGEHYAIDLIAGATLAEAVRSGAGRRTVLRGWSSALSQTLEVRATG